MTVHTRQTNQCFYSTLGKVVSKSLFLLSKGWLIAFQGHFTEWLFLGCIVIHHLSLNILKSLSKALYKC